MADTHALAALVQALKGLPGVGIKSAQRMAFHLLQHDRQAASTLAQALSHAVVAVRHCSQCHTFTEHDICDTCADPQRDRSQLCVVETPADQSAIERTGTYRGLYYVLMGKLSPLDGIGPHDIGLAANFTAEGEATAHVIAEMLKALGLRVTRLARGVPAGSELEYVDLGTIAHALVDRR